MVVVTLFQGGGSERERIRKTEGVRGEGHIVTIIITMLTLMLIIIIITLLLLIIIIASVL